MSISRFKKRAIEREESTPIDDNISGNNEHDYYYASDHHNIWNNPQLNNNNNNMSYSYSSQRSPFGWRHEPTRFLVYYSRRGWRIASHPFFDRRREAWNNLGRKPEEDDSRPGKRSADSASLLQTKAETSQFLDQQPEGIQDPYFVTSSNISSTSPAPFLSPAPPPSSRLPSYYGSSPLPSQVPWTQPYGSQHVIPPGNASISYPNDNNMMYSSASEPLSMQLQSGSSSATVVSASSMPLQSGSSSATVISASTASVSTSGFSGTSTLSSRGGSSMFGGTSSSGSNATFATARTHGRGSSIITPRNSVKIKMSSSETPKTALHSLYGQAPRRKVLSGGDYFTWNDGGPPHATRWTSIFLCPLTGEVFASCPYGEESSYQVRQQGREKVFWYSKKMLAEHSAACRALDCIRLRETPMNSTAGRYGNEEPDIRAVTQVPDYVPWKLRMEIEQRIMQIQQSTEYEQNVTRMQGMHLSSSSNRNIPLP